MKTAVIALACFAAGLAVQNAPEALQYDFNPPPFAADAEGMIFFHFLPAEDNFSANINCMSQPYLGTLEEYDKLSRDQFKQMGMQIITAKVEDGFLVYEYTGRQQGRDMHWYSRACKRGEKIYLITATSLDKKWENDSKVLKDSVDSFKLREAKGVI